VLHDIECLILIIYLSKNDACSTSLSWRFYLYLVIYQVFTQGFFFFFFFFLKRLFICSYKHFDIFPFTYSFIFIQALSPIKIFTVRNGIHSEFIGILPSIVQALFQSLKQPSKCFSIFYSQLFDRGIGEYFSNCIYCVEFSFLCF
jgi:hypothetical protein